MVWARSSIWAWWKLWLWRCYPYWATEGPCGLCLSRANSCPWGSSGGCLQDQSLMDHGTWRGLSVLQLRLSFFLGLRKMKWLSPWYLDHARLIPKIWDTVRTFCFSITTRWNKLWVLYKLYSNTKKRQNRENFYFFPSSRSMAIRIFGPPSIFHKGMVGEQYDK